MGERSTFRHAVRRTVILLATSAAVAALAAPGARAVVNGRIAFEVPPDIAPALATVNPDGSGEQLVPRVPKGSANPAWSADGNRLAFTSTVSGTTQVYTINADGSDLRKVTSDPIAATDPTWSPDGRMLAFTSWSDGLPNIWSVDLDTLALTQLTRDTGINQQPRWSPDGRLIAFASNRSGTFQIYAMAPDGTGQQAITSRPGDNTDPAWSPRGAELAYTNTLNATRQLFAIGRTGTGDRRLAAGDGTDQFPAWSPDGTKIAFAREGSLWVIPSTGETGNAPAIPLGYTGVDPVWAPQPPPIAQPQSGAVTVTQPGSSAQPLTATTPLLTGTVVDATTGSMVVSFKPLMSSLQAPASTALVQNGRFTVAERTAQDVTLNLTRPQCCARAAAARRRPSTRVNGHGRGIKEKTSEIYNDSTDPDYVLVYSCSGTQVRVSKGSVLVTLLHARLPTVVTLHRGRRLIRVTIPAGRRPRVRVPAGDFIFVSARGR